MYLPKWNNTYLFVPNFLSSLTNITNAQRKNFSEDQSQTTKTELINSSRHYSFIPTNYSLHVNHPNSSSNSDHSRELRSSHNDDVTQSPLNSNKNDNNDDDVDDDKSDKERWSNLCKLDTNLVAFCGNDTSSCFYHSTKCNGVSDCPNGYDESVEMCGKCRYCGQFVNNCIQFNNLFLSFLTIWIFQFYWNKKNNLSKWFKHIQMHKHTHTHTFKYSIIQACSFFFRFHFFCYLFLFFFNSPEFSQFSLNHIPIEYIESEFRIQNWYCKLNSETEIFFSHQNQPLYILDFNNSNII